MPKKQQQSFESLVQEAISAGGRPIESLDCSNLPSSTDFFHSIVHRHRVRRYSSFIVPRQAVDSKWPKYSRKFGSAVNLKCDSLGELDVEATKRVGDTAAIHVLDIGDLMSGPRGRAQGGVSAVLIGKCTEELLVEALGTRVSMLANEVDYVVSGMLPLVARTMARLLSIKLHSSKDGSSKKIPMYSVEAILVDNKGTLCSYGISTFVAGSDLHNLPNASIPYFDPAFGPSTEHSVPHSAKSPAFYTPANQPDSVPTYMKPLWNDRNVRHLTNLIPDIVPNPMMFEKDGNRGTFIWGTQFGTEGRHVVGHDGPPSQLTPGGETDTSGLSHRAFTRAFQLLDTRKYYATPEKERKLAMVEGVTTVLLGKGCEHDTVVADRKLGNKEKGEKEIHTGFLFSVGFTSSEVEISFRSVSANRSSLHSFWPRFARLSANRPHLRRHQRPSHRWRLHRNHLFRVPPFPPPRSFLTSFQQIPSRLEIAYRCQ